MKKFLALCLSDIAFIMLAIVGILTVMSRIHVNFVLSWVEYEKSFTCITKPIGISRAINGKDNCLWTFYLSFLQNRLAVLTDQVLHRPLIVIQLSKLLIHPILSLDKGFFFREKSKSTWCPGSLTWAMAFRRGHHEETFQWWKYFEFGQVIQEVMLFVHISYLQLWQLFV